ncbi:MAG: 5-(carboxyamino)imidazole ribonucleotide mutase [Planctomycetota bacterium]
MTDPKAPLVGVIMGSRSDWQTMQHCAATLEELHVPHEVQIVSAHRTPDWLMEYADTAEARGLQILIAAAGGAAHLPGMAASKTVLPVLGVPMDATCMQGMDALVSIVQMPAGVPVGTLAIGKPGAINAALLATSMLGAVRPELREALRKRRQAMTDKVLGDRDPRIDPT